MTSTPAVLASAQPLSVAARPDLTDGRRIGVLLSHGFTGSPGSMRAWGEHLAAKGYAVEVPRLPGHGTHWRDLNTTTWADWYGEVCRAFEKLAAENDAVVVGGLSMGGALVLRLAADNPDRIAGVVVVNPAVAIKRWDVKLLPVLKHLVGAMPGISSDIKKEGVVESAYQHTPLKATHSMMSAWPVLVADLGAITAPLLYFRSTVDHVVDELSEPLILDRISSTDVTVTRLEESYHVATVDNDAERIFADSAAFIARVTAS
ncbi:carboxylesterase [Nocardioides terrae]|uniref:Carboxylesterase n=1 Tax=Nocardioides terrae TaxID=574651 RepID=A0A1I1G983_9ACTN|nr:alpha/beta fold hydrolase [Nocardioides terrae]SFC05903.1 carboxylesterase [Nocardioides terrae]